jgi:hypothetical protein
MAQLFIGTAAIGTKKPEVSFRGSFFSVVNDQRTYSTTIDLGTQHVSRMIVVGVVCSTGSTQQPTACTVNGASAALAVGNSVAGITSATQQLWHVAMPTGTSVTVDFSKPGGDNMDGGALAVWSVYYLSSQTPRAINNTTVAANPSSVDLTVLLNSAVFGVASASNALTNTWAATGLTLDASRGLPGLQWGMGSASQVAAGARTIGFSGLGNNAVSAYWR